MDTSSFSEIQHTFPDAELLPVEGSTCDCYRVHLYGKLHFLKRLKSEFRTDPRYVASLQKEFEIGYRLEHPHLVRYVSKGEDYLMTEYVDGEALSQFVVSHPDYFKSKKNTNRFLSQLLDVLGYLHSHQVVHLDLKPDNILITRIGNDVKLTDLGYCYTDTYTDTMGRTDKYAAPEQLQGGQVDGRTDIYAVGKILETFPCPTIYNKVIARCTAPDPSKRYQTTEEIEEDFGPSSHLVNIGVVVLFLIATLGGLYFLLHEKESQPAIQPQIEQPKPPIDSLVNYPDSEQMSLPSSTTKPIIRKRTPSSEPKQFPASEQLKADIVAAVLPKFNATMGALPDSVKPGTEEWAEAGWAFERELSNTLQELILSHQDIPMQTVAQEYTSYIQNLITIKYNQNSPKTNVLDR